MNADFFWHLEMQLLDPATRRDRGKLLDLLADHFIEFASSGGSYDREQVICSLLEEAPAAREVSAFKAIEIGRDAVLVTYVAERFFSTTVPKRRSLRSSIWQRNGDRWQMVFHQGTAQP